MKLRQRHDDTNGARAPAGLARRPVALGVVKNGQGQRKTPLGYKTARHALPPILGLLSETDRRRRAADAFADAFERIGAVKGVDWAGSCTRGDTKGKISDGGITVKIKHAAQLKMLVAVVNGWPIDCNHGCIESGPERVVLPVKRKRDNRQEIKAFPLMVATCVEGRDLATILRAHGWLVHTKHRHQLGEAVLNILDEMADRLAFDSNRQLKGQNQRD